MVEKKAQQRIYSVNPKKVEELEVWVQRLGKIWDGRFDRLDKILKQVQDDNLVVQGDKLKHGR